MLLGEMKACWLFVASLSFTCLAIFRDEETFRSSNGPLSSWQMWLTLSVATDI